MEETFGLGGLSSRERLLGAGINLGAAQGGALQFGNQLYAGTAQNALANLGIIAGARVGAYDQAAVNQLNNRLAFGEFQTATQLQAAQLGLGFYGQNLLLAPSPNQPAQIYGYGG